MSALLGGLRYIAKAQLAGGGFQSYRLEDPSVHYSKRYRTTFVPSLVALALADVPGSGEIREHIARFLIDQKSSEWSWNYWDRASAAAATMPCPDDLDDTFLALAALWRTDRKLFRPNVMAYIANMLFATEQKPGGPYRTWLAGDEAEPVWRDIDPLVNSNIAYFLKLQDVELPALVALVESAIQANELTSQYYPDTQPAAYFVSRWYKGECAARLQEQVLVGRVDGHWATPHETALAVSTLLRFGHPIDDVKEAVDFLLASQRPNGSWEAGSICYDAARTGETLQYGMGSACLTTAFCLEALQLFETLSAHSISKKVKKPQYEQVISEVYSAIRMLHQQDLRRRTRIAFKLQLEGDTSQEIIMLPWLVAKAFGVKPNEQLFRQLARVSAWGWMAYTIFDDFLDNEGNPTVLPCAITAHRHLLLTLNDTLPGDAGFQIEVRDILNQLDGANAWEVSHCRGVVEADRFLIARLPDYGDYWQLADRSLGHTIAGLGVLYGSRLRSNSIQIIQYKKFFHHYLIARQLNDDAHDWEDDLAKGHVNVVGVKIIKRWMASGHRLKDGIHLQDDKKALRLIMWETVIDEVCRDIHVHIRFARKALAHPDLHIQQEVLLETLVPLEEAAKHALDTRDDAIEFISSL